MGGYTCAWVCSWACVPGARKCRQWWVRGGTKQEALKASEAPMSSDHWGEAVESSRL